MVQFIAVQTFDGEAPQMLHLSHNIFCVPTTTTIEKKVRRIVKTKTLLVITFAAHEMSRHNRSGSAAATWQYLIGSRMNAFLDFAAEAYTGSVPYFYCKNLVLNFSSTTDCF